MKAKTKALKKVKGGIDYHKENEDFANAIKHGKAKVQRTSLADYLKSRSQ